jgi:hypothetical protein
MNAELVRQRAHARTRHSWRHTAVSALGPLTALASAADASFSGPDVAVS